VERLLALVRQLQPINCNAIYIGQVRATDVRIYAWDNLSQNGSTGALIGPAATGGSAQDMQSWGVGVNWYLNPNVRVTLDYFNGSFFGGNGSNTVVQNGEQAILTRLQLNF
jgi:phosphate-selective porin OprO/OprP